MGVLGYFLVVGCETRKKCCGSWVNHQGCGAHGVVVITTAQLHSTKLELRFYAVWKTTRGVLDIRALTVVPAEHKDFCQSTILQKQFFIFIIIITITAKEWSEGSLLDNCGSFFLGKMAAKVSGEEKVY